MSFFIVHCILRILAKSTTTQLHDVRPDSIMLIVAPLQSPTPIAIATTDIYRGLGNIFQFRGEELLGLT